MVKALRRHVDDLREENEQYAETGCKLATVLKRELSAEVLERGQQWLRPALVQTETRLSRLKARRERQRGLLERRVEARPELLRRLGEHQRLLRVRRRVLLQRRRILRQVGDALAWTVCGMEPLILAPLSVRGRRQHVPGGIGGFGPRNIRARAHDTGDYYVVENDLTRCLAVGDLTVVPADAVGSHRVYPIEIKTHGRLEEGAEAKIEAIIPTAEGDDDDREFLETFTERVGLLHGPDPGADYSGRERRQMEEVVDRTVALRRNLGGITVRIPNPRLTHLDVIGQVLHRADIRGVGWDYPERGLAFAAVRLGEGHDAIASLRRAVESLKRAGLGEDPTEQQFVASSYEMHRVDRSAAHITPIALWPLSIRHRMMLLSEQIIFVAWHDAGRIEAAFADRGLDLEWTSGGWKIEKEGCEPLALNRLEVGKATARVLFSGASPAELARGIDDAMEARLRGS